MYFSIGRHKSLLQRLTHNEHVEGFHPLFLCFWLRGVILFRPILYGGRGISCCQSFQLILSSSFWKEVTIFRSWTSTLDKNHPLNGQNHWCFWFFVQCRHWRWKPFWFYQTTKTLLKWSNILKHVYNKTGSLRTPIIKSCTYLYALVPSNTLQWIHPL